MLPKSIRWQLPLSYAAIALLAALSLGAVLLLVLRGYYIQLEKDYLERNARSIGYLVGQSIQLDLPEPFLQSQVNSLAFLSQTRITVFGPENRKILESALPEQTWISFGKIVRPDPNSPEGREEPVSLFYFQIDPDSAMPLLNSAIEITGPELQERVVQVEKTDDLLKISLLPSHYSFIGRSLYGNEIGAEAPSRQQRSDEIVRQAIYNQDDELLGSVQLSDGPAYGREILKDVARGWATAGALSILLAAVVGWFVSKRISQPLTELTGKTTRMASGDLSARAEITRQDEFGRLAQSFNDMAGRVQDTVITLRSFIADAAHELQTPTTALTTDLELTLQSLQANNPHQAEEVYIPRALTQVKRLKALTNNLLNLSRIEGKEPGAAHQTFDLARLLLEMSESVAARAEQAGIDFYLYDVTPPAPITGNPIQVAQAASNLLDNAIKFTPEGGSVTLTLIQETGQVIIEVRDTGIGIPPEDLPYLFKRFHRGKNTAAYPGSGLGLAIVKAIMQQHGGDVTAENAETGAVFRLKFPTDGPIQPDTRLS